MHTRRLLPLLLGTLLLSGPFLPSTAHAQERTIGETVALAPDGAVSIDTHRGRISVTTWDRDAVQYEVEIDAPEGSDGLENTEIRVDRSERTLRLETEYGDDGSWFSWNRDTPPVHYTIQMPRSARLSIDDHESDIDIRGLAAELVLDTHDGSVHIADHTGRVSVDTHDGRVDLQNVTGPLDVDTHDGTLTVENLRGGLVLDAHDGTADVSFGELSGDVEIDTHDGRVTLTLPAGTGFDLAADLNDDASLDTDFDLSGFRRADDGDDELNYRGAVNGGGPLLHLSSHDGRFRLRTP